jgi:hypothetical protein
MINTCMRASVEIHHFHWPAPAQPWQRSLLPLGPQKSARLHATRHAEASAASVRSEHGHLCPTSLAQIAGCPTPPCCDLERDRGSGNTRGVCCRGPSRALRGPRPSSAGRPEAATPRCQSSLYAAPAAGTLPKRKAATRRGTALYVCRACRASQQHALSRPFPSASPACDATAADTGKRAGVYEPRVGVCETQLHAPRHSDARCARCRPSSPRRSTLSVCRGRPRLPPVLPQRQQPQQAVTGAAIDEQPLASPAHQPCRRAGSCAHGKRPLRPGFRGASAPTAAAAAAAAAAQRTGVPCCQRMPAAGGAGSGGGLIGHGERARARRCLPAPRQPTRGRSMERRGPHPGHRRAQGPARRRQRDRRSVAAAQRTRRPPGRRTRRVPGRASRWHPPPQRLPRRMRG